MEKEKIGAVALIFALFAVSLGLSAVSVSYFNSTYYNYTNISGGDVSFNGSAVDMNGSSFYNGSQQAGTFNHSNLTRLNWSDSGHTSDNSKVSKSGDNMTGDLGLSDHKLKMVNTSLRTWEYLSSGYNATLYDVVFDGGEYSQQQFDKYVSFTNHYNGTGTFFTFFTNNSKFIAIDFRPDMSTLYWRFGMDNTDDFKVKRYGGTGKFIIDSSGIQITNLAGSENDYACLDANGQLFRSSSAC